VLRSAESWISARRTTWERRLDRLGDYLAETAGEPDPSPPSGGHASRRTEQEQE
jgi:hypothetical protein